jgi:hypoxanthine-guanine phosphoribosyltransferase
LYELEKNEEICKLIEITKSNSGISGPELVKAHIALGEQLGMNMKSFDPKDTTIVAFLRGGIFFAEGLYFALGCKFQTFDPKHEEFIKPDTKNIILVDSVINTGKSIMKIYNKDMIVACCVINENAVPLFEKKLYTVRVSKNSFVGVNVKKQAGNKGPDTTLRLFNQI